MQTVALLSVKGGCGKTTLGLVMSSILAKAGLKTLLVDCDFSTYGATFFFKDQLQYHKTTVSFIDILSEKDISKDITLDNLLYVGENVGENFYFIPSITQVNISKEAFSDIESSKTYIKDFISSIKNNSSLSFDLIIFDCQTGFSAELPLLLPNIDIKLMVLEPDLDNSSALRELNYNVISKLPDTHVYQVYNKVNREEIQSYEAEKRDVLFPNGGVVPYDKPIRDTFAKLYIPAFEKEQFDYGIQICKLCCNTIRDDNYKKKIEIFKNSLEKNKEEQRKLLLDNESEKIRASLKWQNIYWVISGLLIALIGGLTFYCLGKNHPEYDRVTRLFLAFMLVMLFASIAYVIKLVIYGIYPLKKWLILRNEGKKKQKETDTSK